MTVTKREIGEILVDNGLISSEELDAARAEHEKTGEPIGHVLAKLGLATESNVKNALELQYGVNYVALSKKEPDPEVQKLLPADSARQYSSVPISQQGDRVTIAMVDPSDTASLEAVKKAIEGTVKVVVCLEEDFAEFVDKAYGKLAEAKTEEDSGSTSGVETEPSSPGAKNGTKLLEDAKAAESDEAAESTKVAEDVKVEASAPVAETIAPKETPKTDREKTDLSAVTGEHQPVRVGTPARAAVQANASGPVARVDHRTSEIKIPAEVANWAKEANAEAEKSEQPAEPLGELALAKRAQEEAIVLLANQILGNAIKRHCSNIHILNGPKECVVHYRFNGGLIVDRRLPKTIASVLVARYKMMARLNLAEVGVPLDGHIKVRLSAKEIVCLVSIIPGDHGENIVIWIL